MRGNASHAVDDAKCRKNGVGAIRWAERKCMVWPAAGLEKDPQQYELRAKKLALRL